MSSGERFSIEVGDDAVPAVAARPDGCLATLVLAHGAGAGMDHPFMVGVSDALNALGYATVRFNFPYIDQGRRFPDRAPKAIAVWSAVMSAARERVGEEPVWACGKSFGGRMASMAVAEGMPATGLIFLGYPLHAPGKPEKLRDAHLYDIEVPMLFLQGSNDAFAQRDLLDGVVERVGGNATLQYVEGADHSFAIKGTKRSQHDVGASLAPAISAFVGRLR